MTTRILVPIDFAPPSAAALELALQLAGSLGAEVHLLHVLEAPILSHAPHGPIEELKRFLEPYRDARFTESVVTGEPSSAILAKAAEGDFDLIVMGTQGHKGLKHVLLGSTADWIVRHAQCPVVTTRGAILRGHQVVPPEAGAPPQVPHA